MYQEIATEKMGVPIKGHAPSGRVAAWRKTAFGLACEEYGVRFVRHSAGNVKAKITRRLTRPPMEPYDKYCRGTARKKSHQAGKSIRPSMENEYEVQ